MKASKLTQARLKELLSYDPATGEFIWIAERSGSIEVGQVAGCIASNTGYVQVMVDRKSYLGHRLAMLYMRGAFPSGHIDHANGVKSDNRACNLRAATVSENLQNQRSAHKNSTSPLLGVSWSKKDKRWVAQIGINRKTIKLGVFDDPLEAHKAYMHKKREIHPFSTVL